MAKKTAKKSTSATKKTVKTKKVTKKKVARKKKVASDARKRIVWVIFNNNMKEEGRFPYDQRKEAEKKLELLAQKSKKPFFIQPLKEVISDGPVKTKAKSDDDKDVKSEEE
ncbi:MAG TPA: hypothetical protein VMM56_05555 [Planctomycetaceae bacterium]|nr:hypothetical protein [Planctomycetaceae bacterium]